MPYKRLPERRDLHADHDDMVQQLVNEIEQGETGTGPEIREEQVHGSDRLHVYVIWDRWETVREEQRCAAILDAYERCFGRQRMRLVSIAMGLTPAEAREMGITS